MSPNMIYLIMLVSVKSGSEDDFSHFTKANLPILQKHGIEIFKSVSVAIKGQLVGVNELPQPNFISVYKIPSMEKFMDYMADEQYKKISELRAACTTDVIGYFANEVSLPTPLNSFSLPSERMYVVGLANSIDGSSDGIEDFNKLAIARGLFNKHGMHIELQLKPFKMALVVGESKCVTPDRIQLFFVDHPDNIKEYVSDPLYKELAPIRDNSLLKYDFFAGSLM